MVQNGSRQRACDGAKQPWSLVLFGARCALDDVTIQMIRVESHFNVFFPQISAAMCFFVLLNLAICHKAKEDKAAAASWFEKAAREGHAQAMKNLGKMYAAGDGVPEDPEKSDYWFKKAGMGELYVKGKRARNF